MRFKDQITYPYYCGAHQINKCKRIIPCGWFGREDFRKEACTAGQPLRIIKRNVRRRGH